MLTVFTNESIKRKLPARYRKEGGGEGRERCYSISQIEYSPVSFSSDEALRIGWLLFKINFNVVLVVDVSQGKSCKHCLWHGASQVCFSSYCEKPDRFP